MRSSQFDSHHQAVHLPGVRNSVDGLGPFHWKQAPQKQDDMQLTGPCSHAVPFGAHIRRTMYHVQVLSDYFVHMTRQAKKADRPPSVAVPITTPPTSLSHVSLEHQSRSLLLPCHGPVDNHILRLDICGLDVNDETQPQMPLDLPFRMSAQPTRSRL